MAPPEITTTWAERFWAAGFQLHAHPDGDLSTDLFIDILRRLQGIKPRLDRSMTLEHFARSTEDQNQLRALGAQVSANPYYVHILSDLYSERLLGPDRGSNMVQLGSLERLGAAIALDAASRAITIDAAWIMGWENENGSVRVGKRADFVVLHRDPYENGATELRQIEVLGTVFEGDLALITSWFTPRRSSTARTRCVVSRASSRRTRASVVLDPSALRWR